jgi:hypothetical protein
MKASYKEFDAIVGLQVVHLMPGQFIFGRRKAAEETGLTEREIRTLLALLIKWQNLTIKTTNRFSIISIINWTIYQSEEIENDQLNDQQTTSRRPHTNIKALKKKTPAEISSQISVLKDRYQDQETIDQIFQAIQSIRKSDRIADSVKLSILKAWERYPVESVMAGIKTFLDKGYQDKGKDEKYLLGIIRNNNSQQKPTASMTGGKVRRSEGSRALDDYYRQQGFTII